VNTAFSPVTTRFIYYFKGPLPFDVYIQLADDKFTKVYHKQSLHDPEQIYRFENKEVKKLFIANEEKDLYGNFLVLLIDQFNQGSKTLDKEKMIDVIKTSLELTYEKIVDKNEELDKSLEGASQQVISALLLIEEDMSAAMEIFRALAGDVQLLKHSYMVAIFSIVLAKKLGFNNKKNLMALGLGALLHDIGHTRVNGDLFMKSNLTPKEWDEIKDHPHLGLKIIENMKGITSEIRYIILQHHEQHNGRGYPNRLGNSVIFPPAKIVAIADGFCSFVSKAGYRETSCTPEQALTLMKDDVGHYDPEYFDVFTQIIKGKKKA
jgi:putative nucleotidyltransferase with HDIG domain